MADGKEELYEVTCPECGIVFGFQKRVESLWRESHKTFHCPNGHGLSWKSVTDKEKQLESLKKDKASLEEKLAAANKEVGILKQKVELLTAELEIWKPSETKVN